MMNFPKETELSKFVAKEKFFAKGINGKLAAALTNEIEKIKIINNISRKTLNIKIGEIFPEILFLHILLKQKKYTEKLLNAMDESIPSSYVIFVLEHKESFCLTIAFKNKINSKIKIEKRWHTTWEKNLPTLKIEGQSIDVIYRNFIAQISGDAVRNNQNTLGEEVEIDLLREKLGQEIIQLNTKIANEKQFKKSVELKIQQQKLEKKLKELS